AQQQINSFGHIAMAENAQGNVAVVYPIFSAPGNLGLTEIAPDGQEAFPPTLVTSDAGQQDQPSVAFAPDGTFAVGWGQSPNSVNSQFVARTFNPSGSPLGAESILVPQSGTPGSGDLYSNSTVVYDQINRRFVLI